MMVDQKIVRFNDLSFPLKMAVIISYGVGGLWITAFVAGVIAGMLGV